MLKKSKWHIFCEIKTEGQEKKFKLSFTTNEYLNFVPPNGDVSNFHIHGELSSNHSQLKPGIYYMDSSSRCLVSETSNGISLVGVSHDWQKLKELLSRLLSSAGMEPRITHTKDISMQEILTGWTEAIFALMKQ